MDEPRAYYTEWSESERENQISYIQPFVWNLEGSYWWICSQNSNGDTDIENRLRDKGRGEEGESERNGESSMDAYTLISVIASQLEFVIWLKELKLGLCNNLESWEWVEVGREILEGRDICIPMVNSWWCMTEIKPIL